MDEIHISNDITESIEDMINKLKIKYTALAVEYIKKKYI